MIYLDQSPFYQKWVEDKLGDKFSKCSTIAYANQGRLTCVALFNNYTKDNIELTVAAEPGERVTKGFIEAVFTYCFVSLGVQRVTARILEDNETSIKMTEKLGFVREGRVRRAQNGKDIFIYGMLREECRWVRNPSRQKHQTQKA